MKTLRGLFARQPDPLLARADILVRAANTNATLVFSSLSDQFLFLRDTDVVHWDFILTVAGVFIAVTRLHNLQLGETRERKIMTRVSERLAQWNATHGRQGFEHCKEFFERTYNGLSATAHEPRYVASDAIGAWIVWDIVGHAPENEDERKLTRRIGVIVTHEFFNWWKEPA